MTNRSCKTCKWIHPDGRYSRCYNPKVMTVNERAVYGAEADGWGGAHPEIARGDSSYGTCGSGGAYWEASDLVTILQQAQQRAAEAEPLPTQREYSFWERFKISLYKRISQ